MRAWWNDPREANVHHDSTATFHKKPRDTLSHGMTLYDRMCHYVTAELTITSVFVYFWDVISRCST